MPVRLRVISVLMFCLVFLSACSSSSDGTSGTSSSSLHSPEGFFEGNYNASFIVESVAGKGDHSTKGGFNIYSSDTTSFEGQDVVSVTQFLNTGATDINQGPIEYHFVVEENGDITLLGFTMIESGVTGLAEDPTVIPENVKSGRSGEYGTYTLSNGGTTIISWQSDTDDEGNLILSQYSVTEDEMGETQVQETIEWTLNENGERNKVAISQVFGSSDSSELYVSGETNLKTALNVCVDCRGGSSLTDTRTQLYFTWEEVPGAETYQLYHMSGPGNKANTLLATFPSDKFTFLNSQFKLGAEYCFAMVTTDALGNTATSDEVCVTVADTSKDTSGCDYIEGTNNGDVWVCDDKVVVYYDHVRSLSVVQCVEGCEEGLAEGTVTANGVFNILRTPWTEVLSQWWVYTDHNDAWHLNRYEVEKIRKGNTDSGSSFYNSVRWNYLYQGNTSNPVNLWVTEFDNKDTSLASEQTTTQCLSNGQNSVSVYNYDTQETTRSERPETCPLDYSVPPAPDMPQVGQSLPEFSLPSFDGSDDTSDDGIIEEPVAQQLNCSSAWTGHPDDLQVSLQCETACLYQNAGVTAGVSASCQILNGWNATGSCSSVCSN